MLWHVRREMQFSYLHIGSLNPSIHLLFLQQYLHLVNNLGRGAMKVVRQSKVVTNLLKCMMELKCEMGEEEEKRTSQGHLSLLSGHQVE